MPQKPVAGRALQLPMWSMSTTSGADSTVITSATTTMAIGAIAIIVMATAITMATGSRPRPLRFGVIIGSQSLGGGYGVRPGYTHPRHMRYCYNRYRSYRAYDNTFQPYHGPRRQCRSRYY
jgi:hypothetical protein